tara:strand:+ start:199 stop:504 length:306 start_codon:yes stop_codon:yes gene_type:complete
MKFSSDIAFTLFGLSDQHELSQSNLSEALTANPATGLPVVSKTNIDVVGNPIGSDLSDTASIEPEQINYASYLSYEVDTQSCFDDDFSSDISGGPFDDLSF